MGAYSHFQLPSESILGSSAAINDEAHFQEVPFLFDKTFLQKKVLIFTFTEMFP